jgi:hypothetical protein
MLVDRWLLPLLLQAVEQQPPAAQPLHMSFVIRIII